jgi:hypothetical protein
MTEREKSLFSVLMILLGMGLLTTMVGCQKENPDSRKIPKSDHLSRVEGTITQIHESEYVVWFKEERSGEISGIRVYSGIKGGDQCSITCKAFFKDFRVGDLISIPQRERGGYYYTDEILRLTEFSGEQESYQQQLAVRQDSGTSPVQIFEFPEYSTLTFDSHIFDVSLRNKRIEIYGNRTEVGFHKEKYKLELQMLGEYLNEDGSDSEQIHRMLRNAGFVKVVVYKERSISDLMEGRDFLVSQPVEGERKEEVKVERIEADSEVEVAPEGVPETGTRTSEEVPTSEDEGKEEKEEVVVAPECVPTSEDEGKEEKEEEQGSPGTEKEDQVAIN